VDLVCPRCGGAWPLASGVWRCACGSPLDLRLTPVLDPEAIRQGPPNLWRYAGALPPVEPRHRVSLGEVLTPLVPVDWGGRPVLFKVDYLFPTGSYKDRGIGVMVSALRAAGVTEVVEDSSGNAGASLAAYCARAGIRCTVYAPAAASPAKLVQIQAYGARVVRVPGPRAEATRAAQAAAATRFYASHNWNPLFLHGVKTLAFEIWEQLGWQAPGAVVFPCGFGSLLLGCYLGFQDLRRAGLIPRLPRLYPVQAAGCAPLYRAWARREAGEGRSPAPELGPELAPTGEGGATEAGPTLAEGIAAAQPVRLPQMLAAVAESGGAVLAVTEAEIRAGLRKLSALGFYVEPTSAVVGAALDRLGAAGVLDREGPVVAVLTGSGLKATETLLRLGFSPAEPGADPRGPGEGVGPLVPEPGAGPANPGPGRERQ